MLDLTTPRGAQIHRRLCNEPIIWLSSVRPDGRPHLVPVWFWWDGAAIVIFSKPSAQKVRNLRRNPQVMLALDTADEGEDVVLFEGHADLAEDRTLLPALPGYAEKYAALFVRIGSSTKRMAAEYSIVIRVTVDRLVMS